MDPVFEAERRHLDETYSKLESIESGLQESIRGILAEALEDKDSILGDLAFNKDSDVHVETLAEYEAANRIIDAYNLSADINAEKLRNVQLLLKQPYFAKISVRFKGADAPKDIYIGSAGMTDEARRHFIIDWRSPVAELYYNQENGATSYEANGRDIEVNLELRRQFDIDGKTLNSYFDTTVAIQDPLLLQSLAKRRSAQLTAITTTIQKEQNTVIRHADVPALLVNGIAGSGKTSVLLQRIAYLFYRERDNLAPHDVYLITPNSVFQRYIDNVLPDMGESNPRSMTWDALMDGLGLGSRSAGTADSVANLRAIDAALPSFQLEPADFQDIRVGDERVISAAQARGAYEKLSRMECGVRRCSIAADDLLERLEQRIKRLARNDTGQDMLADLSEEEQIGVFGQTVAPASEEEYVELAERYLRVRYAPVADAIEDGAWLKVDRIGMRLLGVGTLSSVEWLYLKLALAGGAERSARYVMVDEVQDYSAAQLMVLARYFCNAHFLLLGDENQAIEEGTASFAQVREVFEQARGRVDSCSLMTSYRSSPEITDLFCRLMDDGQHVETRSVQRPGTPPRVIECTDKGAYEDTLRELVGQAAGEELLTAVIAPSRNRMQQLARLLGDSVVTLADKHAALPDSGVVLLSIKLAKGLEFDQVIVPDVHERLYPDETIARHKLYTAISRATQQVTLVALGKLTPLLEHATHAARTTTS